MQTVDVAIGVVCRHDRVLISQRSATVKQPLCWEFPGGKVDTNETPEHALRRECKEEIGIAVLQSQPLISVWHDYRDYAVLLHAFMVTNFQSEPIAREGQPLRWVARCELGKWQFPAANHAVLSALSVWFNRVADV